VTRIQRRLLSFAIILTVIGTIVWIARPIPELPATVWRCAATGELREAMSGPALPGYEAVATDDDPAGAHLRLVRDASAMERVRLKFGGSVAKTFHRLWPTGAVVTDGSRSWEEYRVERD
jgi:hypothetical protein